MIDFPSVQKQVIRNHYDVSTLFYRLLWGPHIHHGYWEAKETPAAAQIQLTERLARLAEIAPGSRVYDIGCGMGGSSVWLAKQLGCQVTGVTLSSVQKNWASWAAMCRGVQPRPRFLREDAERIEFEPASADVVWSIECTEHLFDKPAIFRKSAQWVRPGGRVSSVRPPRPWAASDRLWELKSFQRVNRSQASVSRDLLKELRPVGRCSDLQMPEW